MIFLLKLPVPGLDTCEARLDMKVLAEPQVFQNGINSRKIQYRTCMLTASLAIQLAFQRLCARLQLPQLGGPRPSARFARSGQATQKVPPAGIATENG